MEKMKFYDIRPILKLDCQYSMVVGERSNGKTYAALSYGIDQYIKTGHSFALIRRWEEDFKGKRGAAMFEGLVQNDVVRKVTKGEWTDVHYSARRWFFCRYDAEGTRTDAPKPFCYGFGLSAMEHDKSTSYDCTTVIFDEFLTRGAYLQNEFVLFCNVLSTIIRYRDNVKIIMLANTVNAYAPYFHDMGITNVSKMKQGTIDVYNYGESGLRVAVEYCGSVNKKGKPSDVYFAFDNAQLNMITKGVWELELYPHCPEKYLPKDIKFIYFILFENEMLQAEIIQKENRLFTFIHRKTTPIQNEERDHIYSLEQRPGLNRHRNLKRPTTELEKKITYFFLADRVYYQDNEVGEIVRNYLQNCTK